MKKNLAIIWGKENSGRIDKKNLADICGRPAIAYVIDIAKASGVCDKVIVTTEGEKTRDISLQYGADDVVIRGKHVGEDEWHFNDTLDDAIEQYESKTGDRYDDATVLGGTGIFVRPSWIRMSVNMLRNRKWFDSELLHIDSADINGCCQVLKINRYGVYYYNKLGIAHYGINLDIDYPDDLEIARQLMKNIQDGTIDYPLIETVHDNPDRLEKSLRKASRPKHL